MKEPFVVLSASSFNARWVDRKAGRHRRDFPDPDAAGADDLAHIIIALLPLSSARVRRAETNKPLSIAVIGGMVSSTLLTLVVVPAAYSLVIGARERRKSARGA